MTATTNRCDGCGQTRGALAIVPTRHDTANGDTRRRRRRMRPRLCDECVIDRVVTA